uniref:RanBP-type and C3HC4-type zinc finger-containing protein 1 n=1 Tax=Culex pipiens TaxID=7175 RepID=A0A8D8B364_CULPI
MYHRTNQTVDPGLDTIECFICDADTPAMSGIVLQNCGHSFCVEHLKYAMQYGEVPDVDRCPYPYGKYICRKRLDPTEVQFVLQYGLGMRDVEDQPRMDSKVSNLTTDFDQLRVASRSAKVPEFGESSRQVSPTKSPLLKDDAQTDVIRNLRPAKCLLCGDDLKVYKGLVLTRCFHSFCKDCLREWIKAGLEFEVRVVCPVWMGDGSHCRTVLGKKVIKHLLSREDYELYKKKSLEKSEKNDFNRNQIESKVDSIECPCCSSVICLACKAIHPGLNCTDYQAQLKKAADEKSSADAIQALLETGEAMLCPNCQVMLMKVDGCDYVQCTICKFEICWRTRGPRWGPDGPGDISGGCRCKVDGAKCHPKCKGCH